MAFSRPQATSRANSDVLRIARIAGQAERPSIDQMAVIGAIVDGYRAAVPGWAQERNPRPEYPVVVTADPCDTAHPDHGCADVGCNHNCEEWAERQRAALPES